MTRKADEHLQHQLEQKLLAHGLRPPCRVTVVVRGGVVTVSGTVQHDYQRNAVVHACRSMTGVKRIVNNVQAPGFHNVWKSTKDRAAPVSCCGTRCSNRRFRRCFFRPR